MAALSSLHVDDGAERAVEGAAAAGIDGPEVGRDEPPEVALVHDRTGSVFKVGKLIEVAIDRFQLAAVRGLENLPPVLLDFAGDDGDAGVDQLLDLGGDSREERQHTAYVEAAEEHRHSLAAELEGQVRCAAELVRLHAHERHHRLFAGPPVGSDDCANRGLWRRPRRRGEPGGRRLRASLDALTSSVRP